MYWLNFLYKIEVNCIHLHSIPNLLSVFRYEFYEKIDLESYVDKTIPAAYTLHAVLVHSGKFSV